MFNITRRNILKLLGISFITPKLFYDALRNIKKKEAEFLELDISFPNGIYNMEYRLELYPLDTEKNIFPLPSYPLYFYGKDKKELYGHLLHTIEAPHCCFIASTAGKLDENDIIIIKDKMMATIKNIQEIPY